MKKTIFCHGFRLDQHVTFLRILARDFRIACFLNSAEAKIGLPDSIIVEDELVPEDYAVGSEELSVEFSKLRANLNRRASEATSVVQGELSEDAVVPLKEYSRTLLSMEKAFVAFCEKVKVDLILVDCEQEKSRRILVLQGKSLGIPIVNMLHGFYGHMPDGSLLNSGTYLRQNFLADYLVVDNKLEQRYFESIQNLGPRRYQQKILPWGTPIEASYAPGKTKDKALAELDLYLGGFTVGIIPSWYYTGEPGFIEAKLFEADFFREVFSELAQMSENFELQVVLKAHPAFALDDVYPGWTEAIYQIAKETGLKQLQIRRDKLSEVIEASDFLVSNMLTSVVWDGLICSKPSVIRPTTAMRIYQDPSLKNFDSTNPLYEAKSVIFAHDQNDLGKAFSFLLDSGKIEDIVIRLDKIKNTFGIRARTIEDKAQSITRGLNGLLTKSHLNCAV